MDLTCTLAFHLFTVRQQLMGINQHLSAAALFRKSQ